MMLREDWGQLVVIVMLGLSLVFNSIMVITNARDAAYSARFCEMVFSDVNQNDKLRDPDNYDKLLTYGLYFPSEEYYCVWTQGDAGIGDYHGADPILQDINRTGRIALHEYLHAVLYEDDDSYEHFCEDDKNN